jgi:protocatechuate 3,4-dioxygenase beta subunit
MIRGKWRLVACLGTLLYGSIGQAADTLTCQGRIVDQQDRAVSEASIKLYVVFPLGGEQAKLKCLQSTQTDANGVFTLEVPATVSEYGQLGTIIVDKAEFAFGWANWDFVTGSRVSIRLTAPSVLAGQVMGAAGKPVADAEVSIAYIAMPVANIPCFLAGDVARLLFSKKTDRAGVFRFERIPANAGAEFTVKKAKQKAMNTFSARSVFKLSYQAGQGTIRLDYAPNRIRVRSRAVPGPVVYVSGRVLDPNNQPMVGVKLRVLPVCHDDVLSDGDGQFKVTWNPRQWGSEEPTWCLVARHPEQNLASTDIVEVNQVDVSLILEPAIALSGQIVDVNKVGIPQATARLMLRMSNWGSGLGHEQITADQEGHFEILCVPVDQEYYVTAAAKGFGKKQERFDVTDTQDQFMDLGQFHVVVANLRISGMVVDANDQPVAGARIYGYGEGQPDIHNIKTDNRGTFTIPQVCAGRLSISANYYGPGRSRQYGNVETEGGATDVKVIISPSGNSRRFIARKPPSLMGKPVPTLQGLGRDIQALDQNDTALLFCFWDMQQRPSRHLIKQLAKQATLLAERGVKVIGVQTTDMDEAELTAWLKTNHVPFKVGIITAEAENPLFNWGVQSMPWMILTNTNREVVAEGFSIGKLAAQLDQQRK